MTGAAAERSCWRAMAFDRGAKLGLVKRAGHGVLGVDRRVALLGGTKFVDEIVLAEVEIGDVDQIRIELTQERSQQVRQGLRLGRQVVQRVKLHAWIRTRVADLNQIDALRRTRGIERELLDHGRVGREYRLQLRGCGR